MPNLSMSSASLLVWFTARASGIVTMRALVFSSLTIPSTFFASSSQLAITFNGSLFALPWVRASRARLTLT